MNTTIYRILQRGFAVLFLSTAAQMVNAATDITISTAATSNITYSAGVYTPNAGAATAVINATELQTYLATTSVTINTSSTGGGTGNITQNSGAAISKTSGGNTSLTMNAAGAITLNDNITSSSGQLAVTLNANGGAINATGTSLNTNGGLLTFNTNASGTVSSVISGSGGLTKSGTGVLTLTGANTYTGATTINVATGIASIITGSSPVGNSPQTVLGPGQVWPMYAWTSNGNYTLIIQGDGHFYMSNLGVNIWDAAYGGGGAYVVMQTDGNLVVKNTSGTTVWTSGTAGASTRGGSLILGSNGGLAVSGVGGLKLGNASALGNSSAVTASGTLDLGGYSPTIGSLAGSGLVTNSSATAATLTTGGNNANTTFSGTIETYTGMVSLTKTGTGTQTLTGTNTYTGSTTISGGTLQVGTGGAGSINNTSSITDNGALVYNAGIYNTNPAITALSIPAVSGTGTLSVTTTSILNFNGAVNLTGASSFITASAGVNLNVNGAMSLGGTGNVTLLAAQGASGALTDNSAITTNGGAITLYAGRNSSGTDLSQVSNVVILGNITSNGGNITAMNSTLGGTGNSGIGVSINGTVSSGAGNVTLTGYGHGGYDWAQGVHLLSGTVSATSGAITITGQGGNASGGTSNMSSGVLFGAGAVNVYTTSGAIAINGAAGTTGNTHGINFWGGATYKIYSTSGSVNLQAAGGSWGIVAGWASSAVASNVYIGWDGASTITSGAVNIQSANTGGSQWLYNYGANSDLAASPFQIRSTGAIALGSQTNLTYNGTANLSGNGGLTVSNAMLASGAKSYLLGDVTTSGVTENVTLATNATADNAIGIKVVSKSNATISAALTTSAASGIPVTILAAQGAAGKLSVNSNLTTAGGNIKLYSALNASGADLNFGSNSDHAVDFGSTVTVTSGGGNIDIQNSQTVSSGVGWGVFFGSGTVINAESSGATGGNITIKGRANDSEGIEQSSGGALTIKTKGIGTVNMVGISTGNGSGMLFYSANTMDVHTQDGALNVVATTTSTSNPALSVANSATAKIYATGAGNISINATGSTSVAPLGTVTGSWGNGTALYIGYDNGSNVTTGNVSVTMAGGSPNFTNTYIKSNGGAVTIGDNGSTLGALTLGSGVIQSSTNGYKSFYIGGTNTSGVTVNTALTTNATADNVIGIKVVSKGDATVSAALNSSAVSSVPVTILAAQGAAGTATIGGNLTTNGGTVKVLAGLQSDGVTSTGQLGSTYVAASYSITTSGGAVTLANSSSGANNGRGVDMFGTVNAGSGVVTITGYTATGDVGVDIDGGSSAGSVSGSSITIYGKNTYTTAATNNAGVRLIGAATLSTTGDISVTGDGGTAQVGISSYNGYLTKLKISSSTGNVTLLGKTSSASAKAVDFSLTSTTTGAYIYIGWDGSSSGTTGNISITGQSGGTGSIDLASYGVIKSNGGAITIGDNGSSLGALSLNSGTISSAGNYKSFYIGGTSTNGVTVNAALTTNATADNTVGIKVISKSDAIIGAALTTSAASHIPVTILAAQGAVGSLINNSSVTTSGGAIIAYAGLSASGIDLSQVGTVQTGTLASTGGNITIANSAAGGGNIGGRSDGVFVSGAIAADGVSAGGNIVINGKGDVSSLADYNVGIRLTSSVTTGHSGGIALAGTGGVSAKASNGAVAGVFLDYAVPFSIAATGSGAVTVMGTGGSSTYATNGAPGIFNYEGSSRTVSIYSGSGTTSVTANSDATSSAILEGAFSGQTSTLNIGWDGGSNIGTGDVLVNGSGGTTSGGLLGYGTGGTGNIFIRSNGGAVKVGDNGSSLGALTLNSGTVSSAGNYKSFYIGGTNTNGVTVNAALTTNVTADNAVGIKVVSKSDATIGAALATSAATGIPVSILAAQGAAGNIALGTSTITASGGTVTLDDATTGSGNITGTGAMSLGSSGGLVLNTAGTTGSLSGIISGSGSGVTKNGSGLVTLSGANTYTGATTISAGTLKAGNASAFGVGSAVTENATMDMAGYSIAIGSLAGSGTVTESSATAVTLTTGGNNANTTFSGVIQNGSGTTMLVKTGTGTQTLAGSNTYTGNTAINAGKLVLNPPATPYVLTTGLIDIAGGTLSTVGIGSGYTIDGSANTPLKLSDNGFIELDGTQVHSLKFKPSTAQTWTSGKTLSILNWKGLRATSGTKGKVYVGSNNTGLTSGQSNAVKFNMPTNANTPSVYLPTGEVVALVDGAFILFTIP